MRKIVVVTPVKNEAWILDRFLAVCSQFADAIIVADQHSTDGSRDIYRKFGKVSVIENASGRYDEASRQKLLLDAARRLVPGDRFVLALDADEVITADSLNASSWARTQTEDPGSVFFYEKPDIASPPSLCRRSTPCFPLGFVDDGSMHEGDLIHSTRIPLRSSSPRVEINDIKFAHLAFVRPAEFWARQRLYSLIERVQRTKTLRQRLGYYSPRIQRSVIEASLTPTPESWLKGWRSYGIDLESFATSDLNHYNREIFRLIAQHGVQEFAFDDVWDIDWEALRRRFASAGSPAFPAGLPPIKPPGLHARTLTSLLVALIRLRRALHRS